MAPSDCVTATGFITLNVINGDRFLRRLQLHPFYLYCNSIGCTDRKSFPTYTKSYHIRQQYRRQILFLSMHSKIATFRRAKGHWCLRKLALKIPPLQNDPWHFRTSHQMTAEYIKGTLNQRQIFYRRPLIICLCLPALWWELFWVSQRVSIFILDMHYIHICKEAMRIESYKQHASICIHTCISIYLHLQIHVYLASIWMDRPTVSHAKTKNADNAIESSATSAFCDPFTPFATWYVWVYMRYTLCASPISFVRLRHSGF